MALPGLTVNLLSARLLRDNHHYGHHHHRNHDHHHGYARVNNLRAAYLHALTSGQAIVALLIGRWQDWLWIDPPMGRW